MPTTSNRNLTLVRNGSIVTIQVSYDAVFSQFERNLANLGLRFLERIDVIGVDPPGATTGTVLSSFVPQIIPVLNDPDGIVPRLRSRTLTRLQLDEDPTPFAGPDFNADEIRCRIRIEAIGLPPAVTPDAFTDQEVLSSIIQSSTDADAPSPG